MCFCTFLLSSCNLQNNNLVEITQETFYSSVCTSVPEAKTLFKKNNYNFFNIQRSISTTQTVPYKKRVRRQNQEPEESYMYIYFKPPKSSKEY